MDKEKVRQPARCDPTAAEAPQAFQILVLLIWPSGIMAILAPLSSNLRPVAVTSSEIIRICASDMIQRGS